MRSSEALLFLGCIATPSASFTPSSRRTTHLNVRNNSDRRWSSSSSIGAEQEEDTVTFVLDDGYDPAVAFNKEPPLANLAVSDLEKEFASAVPDLDGNPLTAAYLAKHMGIETVDSYTCPQQEVFRGLMSNGCRINLQPGGETAFYKCIVFEHLSHAQEKLKHSPFKLARDAQSYEVVANFLKSKACQAATETTGVIIPKSFHSDLRPNSANPIETKCSFLLEDLSPEQGWYQHWLLLDMAETKASLQTLAKIHAFFWHGSNFWKDQEAGRELEAAVWESGSYVQPTAQNADQCSNVAKEWKIKRTKFEEHLSSMDCWDNLGDRLQSVATECGRLAHPFADDDLKESYQKYRTFTHGDPKQANFLFRRSASNELEIGLIDFQWAGFGLAATDIAHFMTSAVHANLLVNGGEANLLEYYFDELQTHLVEYGAYDTAEDAVEQFSYETFMDQYEVGVLDLCRLVIAYTWDRFDQAVEPYDKEGCTRTMNKTSYNKSIPNAIWLVSRCDEIMKLQQMKVAKMMLLGQ
ncbi:unnamed protein product [Cylindrotheca closterium]|uniref:CHK kinase-like domain-containing protein n=1 Tax=Cylindrotheca closterium TaxID=2856 RepID=A0AAD2JHG6_9STRA|nr:unnamed protein product [Cylindrotheca closterium]